MSPFRESTSSSSGFPAMKDPIILFKRCSRPPDEVVENTESAVQSRFKNYTPRFREETAKVRHLHSFSEKDSSLERLHVGWCYYKKI